ncbi:hypothetical protein Tco_1563566 [Tanacetum coccineum]
MFRRQRQRENVEPEEANKRKKELIRLECKIASKLQADFDEGIKTAERVSTTRENKDRRKDKDCLEIKITYVIRIQSIEVGSNKRYPTTGKNIHKGKENEMVGRCLNFTSIQDDCDVQATNIILHGLPPDVYALVNHQEAAKDIWDKVKMLMKGTELSYQERECRLYNLFDKFAYVQGETLYEYYWRFSQLINDMHTIRMTMQKVQVNTKFLNVLPSEWSKFVTDV